jgi:hypothetical protein
VFVIAIHFNTKLIFAGNGNTLIYYDVATTMAVKSFIVQAPGGRNWQLIYPH